MKSVSTQHFTTYSTDDGSFPSQASRGLVRLQVLGPQRARPAVPSSCSRRTFHSTTLLCILLTARFRCRRLPMSPSADRPSPSRDPSPLPLRSGRRTLRSRTNSPRSVKRKRASSVQGLALLPASEVLMRRRRSRRPRLSTDLRCVSPKRTRSGFLRLFTHPCISLGSGFSSPAAGYRICLPRVEERSGRQPAGSCLRAPRGGREFSELNVRALLHMLIAPFSSFSGNGLHTCLASQARKAREPLGPASADGAVQPVLRVRHGSFVEAAVVV